jgi:hypothetical protein
MLLLCYYTTEAVCRPCRTLVEYQLNYSTMSSQPPLQFSTELSTLNAEFSTDNYLTGWRPFHTNFLLVSSDTDFQLRTRQGRHLFSTSAELN